MTLKASASSETFDIQTQLAKPKSTCGVNEREQYETKAEFLVSVIGFCVGLGNVWRFPYLCYKNGGGAFLIPYVFCALLGGVPLFFLEVGIGQFMSEGGISVWKMCPLFRGIGYASIAVCNLLNMYYIIVIAWAMYYFFMSMQAELPWNSCGNWWNTDACVSFGDMVNHSQIAEMKTLNITPKDSVVEFWENRVLQITSGIDEMGTVVWALFGTLALSWLLTYFAVWKGVKVTGKIMYFTATFPYVMLTALLIRGVTLEGAGTGLHFYLSPRWEKILEYQVWNDAGTQIFFSYAIGLGGMVALGSYNKFNNDFVRQCAYLCLCNSGTSIFAGFGIFSVLGFMSYQLNIPMEEVAKKGPGLAFIAYPKAMARMPLAPLWSALFFAMILFVGLNSQFVQVESVVTAAIDLFPDTLRRRGRRELLVAILCIFNFTIGCTMIMQGGMYVFQIFDYFSSSSIVLLTICFCECLAIGWIYGADRFSDNVEMMRKKPLSLYLKLCWKYLTPILTLGMTIFGLVYFPTFTYNSTYVYPAWAVVVGWSLTVSVLFWIPAYVVYKLFKYPGSLRERWIASTRPILKDHHLRPVDRKDPSCIYNPMVKEKPNMEPRTKKTLL